MATSRLDACSRYFNEGIEMLTKCEDCKCYNIDFCSAFDDDCKGCPMHYESHFSGHTCHCCAYITRDELKQKRCKFYKPKGQEGCVCGL